MKYILGLFVILLVYSVAYLSWKNSGLIQDIKFGWTKANTEEWHQLFIQNTNNGREIYVDGERMIKTIETK